MDAFNGKYYLQGSNDQEATILLLKDKISIGIRDETGNPLVVYWPYEQIIRDNFWKRGHAIVRCGSYPVQTIEVDSKEFAEKLEAIFRHKERSWLSRALNKNVVGMIKVLVIFFVLVAAAYVWVLPYLTERLAKRVPVAYEEKLGNGLYNAFKENFIIDSSKTVYINDFFKELKISTKYNISVTVVKDDITNAFALPGGHIIVYDKMLAGIDHYEDLAALLSHEFIHIENRHTTKSLFRQLGSRIFLSVIVGDIGSISNTIIGQADKLKGLDYSRSLEKEADMNGLKILSERKIDGNGYIRLFSFLQNESERSETLQVKWISSHPDLNNRIEYLKKDVLFNKNGVEQNEILKTLFLKIKTGD